MLKCFDADMADSNDANRMSADRTGAKLGVAAALILPAMAVIAQSGSAAKPEAPDASVAQGSGVIPELDPVETLEFSAEQRPAVGYFFEAGARYSSPSELDGTDTEVSVARLRGAGGLSFRLNDTTNLLMRIGSEVSIYEFDGRAGAGVIPGMPGVEEPFDAVHATTFAPLIRSMPKTGWHWTLGARVTIAGEGGADFGDSIAAGGFGLASYDISDTFRLGAGVNIVTRLEGGLFVFPIPVIEWDITDTLQLGTTERGFGLTHFLNDSWRFGVQVGFLRREFRLADDNAISEGSFTDWRVPVTLSATYAPTRRTMITARIGSEVLGEMEFNNRDGNEIANYDLSPTILVGFDLRIVF